MTNISRSLLVIGLIIGSAIGYGLIQVQYQPQISQLQSEVDQKTEAFDAVQLELDSVRSEKENIETSYLDLQSDYSDLETQYTILNDTQNQILQLMGESNGKGIIVDSFPVSQPPLWVAFETFEYTSEVFVLTDLVSIPSGAIEWGIEFVNLSNKEDEYAFYGSSFKIKGISDFEYYGHMDWGSIEFVEGSVKWVAQFPMPPELVYVEADNIVGWNGTINFWACYS